MLVLTTEQIKEWDKYTIEHEPISSIDLMERASSKCVEWIETKSWSDKSFQIFCGSGNNGGDGLVIGRLLLQKGYTVSVFVVETSPNGSPDFNENLKRLKTLLPFTLIKEKNHLEAINEDDIIIDALLGSGLNKPITGLLSDVVNHINSSTAVVISIDVPSGLFLDKSSINNAIIKATYTLSFECYKTALLVQENAAFIGLIIILDIGLHPNYYNTLTGNKNVVDVSQLKKILKTRNPFSHKGDYGHALLVAGSYGKMGAAVLATKACLRSGAGLTTALIPKCGYTIMQISAPEAMVITDNNEEVISSIPGDIEKYSSIGIGPGLGTHTETQKAISYIVKRYSKPLVIDADGLNILSLQKELLNILPENSILTPHPKEFERLFGKTNNDFKRIELARQKAYELSIIIVLKSHHTIIVLPTGQLYFNTTGNAGLAKGGSGDVLTGILTALLAQNYEPADAALLGVYLHGLSADLASDTISKESMIAGDVIEFINKAFATFAQK